MNAPEWVVQLFAAIGSTTVGTGLGIWLGNVIAKRVLR